MKPRRILLLTWLGIWALIGLAVIGNYFGAEYGVVYLFTVFPAALFIDTVKDDRRRKTLMSGFVMLVGLFVGYCAFESKRAWSSGALGVIISLLLHLGFERLLRMLSEQAKDA